MGDTRLSFVASSTKFSRGSDRIECGYLNYQATVTADWDDPALAGRNLKVVFASLENRSRWNIRAWLNPDSLMLATTELG